MILAPSHQRPPITMAALFRHQSRRCLPWLWRPSGLGAQPRGLARAAASPKAAPLPEEELVFQQGPRAALAFPELLEPGKRAVLVCVDPDINGALAVLSWHNPTPASSNGSSSSSRNGSSSSGSSSSLASEVERLVQTHSVEVAVHDMPVTIWQMASRSKKQPDAAALLELLRHHSGQGSSLQGSGVVLRAIVEHTTPQHLSGKHAWYGMGYSSGLLTGLLTSQDVPYQRVDAASWKRHLGLYRLGKEGSLALARQLFPQALDSLKRKKDHGRAEAMLIAAWGLGVRTALAAGAASSSTAGAGAAEVGSSSAHSAASSEGAADAAEAEAPAKRRRSRKAQAEGAAEGGSPAAAADQQDSGSSVGSLEAAVTASPCKQRKPRKKASDADE